MSEHPWLRHLVPSRYGVDAPARREPGQPRGLHNNDTEGAMVRCKLRVMERSESLVQDSNAWHVRMLPVIGKSASYPGGAEENAAYFAATPSGEVSLRFAGEPPFVVGSYVYLDLVRDGEVAEGTPNTWNLHTITVEPDTRRVAFGVAWGTHAGGLRHGTITFDVNNKGAWPSFAPDLVGTKWRATFTPADAPAPGLAVFPS